MTPSIDQALHQFLTLLLILTLLPNLTFYLIARGFHRTFATGAACQQRTLTPPDTWSCPTLGLASVLMLRPISPELVLFLDFRTSLGTSVFACIVPIIMLTCDDKYWTFLFNNYYAHMWWQNIGCPLLFYPLLSSPVMTEYWMSISVCIHYYANLWWQNIGCPFQFVPIIMLTCDGRILDVHFCLYPLLC